MKYLVFTVILMVLVSCEKVIPLDTEAKKPKLVVNSGFNADSSWLVHISSSLSVLDNANLSDIEGANVVITDPNGVQITLDDKGYGLYTHASIPATGVKYRIDVSANNYNSVYASNAVPIKATSSIVDTTRIRRFDTDYMEVTVEIDDPVGEHIYAIEVTVRDTGLSIGFGFPEYIIGNSSQFDNYNPEEQRSMLFLKDESFDGSTARVSILVPLYNFDLPYFAADLNVMVCSQDAYNYLSSYVKYEAVHGDPFAQPVQVYTNVTNGLGIFAGISNSYSILN